MPKSAHHNLFYLLFTVVGKLIRKRQVMLEQESPISCNVFSNRSIPDDINQGSDYLVPKNIPYTFKSELIFALSQLHF